MSAINSQNVAATPLSKRRVPEILAPAGGRAQFLAALQSGADAVYLGLPSFNARARADNFSLADLRELLPLAHAFDMKVLVTFNILLKDGELAHAIETLAELEELGVHAIIVQDLAVARLVRKYFPSLRLHASTQMAVHNVWGAEQAQAYGFKRVVLARELTAQELRQMRAHPALEHLELEAFCHGSLCYSYSGLCFFSGAEDARSGNRGECAYTCRQPYKIVSEPGHGFLFSMRDLDTLAYLDKFVGAGIDCLKIEGRKKDAQYVSTVVRAYRARLNELMQTDTLRPAARALVQANFSNDDLATIQADLAVTFQRRPTSFFLKSRYHENVIDLDNPSHLGLLVGTVQAVNGSMITLRTAAPLTKFDGLRITPHQKMYHARPQHGETLDTTQLEQISRRFANEDLQFSLRFMSLHGKSVTTVPAGTVVDIDVAVEAADTNGIAIGDAVFKVRSNDLKQRVEKISTPPAAFNLKDLMAFKLAIDIRADDDASELIVELRGARRNGKEFIRRQYRLPRLLAEKPSLLQQDLRALFAVFGDVGFIADLSLRQDAEQFASWFVPKSLLKEIKREFAAVLPQLYHQQRVADVAAIRRNVLGEGIALGTGRPDKSSVQYAIKFDRLDYLPTLITACEQHPEINELVFEPKRAFFSSDEHRLNQWLRDLVEQTRTAKIHLRLALPTVLRAWDAPLLKVWFTEAYALGVRRFEIGNIGGLQLLSEWGLRGPEVDLSSDFTLYSLNREASGFWRDQGLRTITTSIEDDRENLHDHLRAWPADCEPQVILFKDTPLFIAEACTLTALHNGCPTAKVCGYRSLVIENQQGERFHVAHESCKSIVYGEQAFSWSQHQREFVEFGVRKFRVDFLTRVYTGAQLNDIITACLTGTPVPATHPANYERTLL